MIEYKLKNGFQIRNFSLVRSDFTMPPTVKVPLSKIDIALPFKDVY